MGNATHTIRGNTIQNLTNSGNNAFTLQDASVIGICERLTSGTFGAQITANIIRPFQHLQCHGNQYPGDRDLFRCVEQRFRPTILQRNWITTLHCNRSRNDQRHAG